MVDDGTSAVSHVEAVTKFRIIDTVLSQDTGRLAPSPKPKRTVMLNGFAAADVDALYEERHGDA
ncbi:hypothetical protein [Streptomyces adustus]